MDHALHALNRFGLGARHGERRRMTDPRGWLDDQLEGKPPELGSAAHLSTFPRAAEELAGIRRARRDKDREAIQMAVRAVREAVAAEARAALTARVASERPFVERLVAFWSNHLCVSAAAGVPVARLAGLYERQAIRPHVLGRFEDMVLASARHPAMLLYLDNARSIGPSSAAGRSTARSERPRGLNENYARELMELHTLGVDGGYTQADVQEVARVLTGWTVQGVGERGGRRGRFFVDAGSEAPGFVFREALHEPGAKTVMGERYEAAGEREGEAVIRALCRHPSTARFLATKLARHFVADEPPAGAVDALARAWGEGGGDLRAVARALVRLDAAWDPRHLKLRTPQDWLVAVMRALDAAEAPEQLAPVLARLRQPLWAPGSPKGYADTRAAWADPDALMNRAELARSMASRIARPGLEPAFLLDVIDVEAGGALPAFLADEAIPAEERVALALAGPDFQWR